MITFLIVIVFIIANFSMIISNKSNFKILFSFLVSLIVFIFLNNLKYEYADLYLNFITLMNFMALSYVKFSQTGRIRVLPSKRNNKTNNMMPIVSSLVSTLLVLILLNGVSDEILERDILSLRETSQDYFHDVNIMFVAGISFTVLFIFLMKRVRE
ncbi:MAG: hypothetical protein CES88_08435 [Halobacteriovorax sp. JY17]|nr:MAG: hypothetical protein CES88_08435 [Halobacteriovorax sp. JY17]